MRKQDKRFERQVLVYCTVEVVKKTREEKRKNDIKNLFD